VGNGIDIQAIAARRRYKADSACTGGEVFRAVLDVLRTAEQPLTSREISEALLHKAGTENPSVAPIRGMLCAVHTSPGNHQSKTIERVGDGMPAIWKLR